MNEIVILAIGYVASLLLAVSLLVTNDLTFRWLNTLGCVAFIVYGIMINALPIIITNAILMLINGFHLVRIYHRNENFDILEFNSNDTLIVKFLSFYKNDIANYFPEYIADNEPGSIRFVVLRDMVIANIFIATIMEDGTGLVKLNYTIPKYRDYKVGKFLFQKEKQLLHSRGIRRLVYTHVHNKKHESYLIRMGFEREVLEKQSYFHKAIL